MKKSAGILCLITVVVLGATTLLGYYRQHQVMKRCPAPGDFISVEKRTLHYLQREGGEVPVVFIHGASSNSREWQQSLFDHLPKKFHLVALDRPGLGHSERDPGVDLHGQVKIIHQAIQQLELKRPVLVAHSLSGVLGARLLTDYPAYYQGLVLIAGAVYPIGTGSSWYTKLAALPGVGHLFRHAIIPAIAPFISPDLIENNFHPQAVVADYSERSCLELLFSPARFLANAEDLNQVRSFLDESYPLYSGIAAPVSLVYGDRDQVVAQFSHAGGFKYQVPHAEYIMLANTGHLLHYFHQGVIRDEIIRISSTVASKQSTDPGRDQPPVLH
ncbi:MAG: alpha/beta hydrolase [Desulforhopalus sp.]